MQENVDNRKSGEGAAFAVYWAVELSLFVYPLGKRWTEVNSFARVFGQGILADFDVSGIVRAFYLQFFLFAVFLLAFVPLVRLYGGQIRDERRRAAWKMLDRIAWSGLALQVFSSSVYYAGSHQGQFQTNISGLLIRSLLILHMCYLLFHFDKVLSLRHFHAALVCGIGIVFPFIFLTTTSADRSWQTGIILALAVGTLTALASGSILYTKFGRNKRDLIERMLHMAAACFALIPAFSSAFVELTYVLTQYGIFITEPRKLDLMWIKASLLGTALILFAITCSRARRGRKDPLPFTWERWVYPVLILGFGMLSVQAPLQQFAGADLFETANSSVLISDFINFGRLPIVEHYGGKESRKAFSIISSTGITPEQF